MDGQTIYRRVFVGTTPARGDVIITLPTGSTPLFVKGQVGSVPVGYADVIGGFSVDIAFSANACILWCTPTFEHVPYIMSVEYIV